MDVLKLLIILASFTTICQGIMPFKTQCLYWHNYYRRIHQVGPVVWSDALQSEAEAWAKYLADNNKFQHSPKNPGNLYMTGGRPKEYCTDAIRLFYGEEKFYDYDNPGYRRKAGHFTQVVWKHTKRIGAAWAIRKDKRLVVVVKYNPNGNYARYFNTNVFPPITPTVRIELTTLPSTTNPFAIDAAAGNAAISLTLIVGSLILGVLIK